MVKANYSVNSLVDGTVNGSNDLVNSAVKQLSQTSLTRLNSVNVRTEWR
ncbi:hypothetical protein PanWU01x14_264510 [Parasponia andersonii]|uniref:Uncharacterized protein n=1 Tax=Parasponia andersonii TaxID=3476 RepID=A0A2P5B7I2_PARAD|nr:hypothetical protein PanWU01x14_264510 [Parasponia andersonii]